MRVRSPRRVKTRPLDGPNLLALMLLTDYTEEGVQPWQGPGSEQALGLVLPATKKRTLSLYHIQQPSGLRKMDRDAGESWLCPPELWALGFLKGERKNGKPWKDGSKEVRSEGLGCGWQPQTQVKLQQLQNSFPYGSCSLYPFPDQQLGS